MPRPEVHVGRIAFDQFDPARAARLGAIETRFPPPVETVDELIAAGSEALRTTRPSGRSARGCDRPADRSVRESGHPQRTTQPARLTKASRYQGMAKSALRRKGGRDVAPNFYPAATGVGRLLMPSWVVMATVRGAEPSKERSAADCLVAA